MNECSRDGLEQARAKWWATVSTGDLDGYLDLFADDAVWVTPELDEISGRDAIRSWLEPVFAQFDYELTITVADVRIAGELGIERARFLSRMTPKMSPFRPRLVGDPTASGPSDTSPAIPTVTDPDAVAWGESGDPHPASQVHAAPDLVAAGDLPEDDENADDDAEDDRRPDADVGAPLQAVGLDPGDDEPHEGRYLMYWRWHGDGGWLVERYADVTGIG